MGEEKENNSPKLKNIDNRYGGNDIIFFPFFNLGPINLIFVIIIK